MPLEVLAEAWGRIAPRWELAVHVGSRPLARCVLVTDTNRSGWGSRTSFLALGRSSGAVNG